MVIGACKVSPLKFTCINALGAAVWATLFASGGYWAGEFLEGMLGDLKPYRLPIALGVIALMVAVAVARHYRARSKAVKSL